MRILVPILLVICCLAATLRIEGVWPPESVRHQIEVTIDKVAEPGRALAALVGEYLSPDRDENNPRLVPRPAAMLRAVVDGHGKRESSAPECS